MTGPVTSRLLRATAASPILAKCRVLLIEDERVIREVLVRFLNKAGIKDIVQAPSAESAWTDLFGEGAQGFHVIITDITLPGISGAQFIKKLRSLPAARARAIPIIVLTGDSSTETYKTLSGCNISSYLIKPISADLLRAAIEEALGFAVPQAQVERPTSTSNAAPTTAQAEKPVKVAGSTANRVC